MTHRVFIVWIASLLLCAGAVQAQQVWRCGADGRSYSDRPCKEGTSLDVAEPRPAADLQSATERSKRDALLAESMRKERLQREAQAAAKPTPAPKPKASSSAVDKPASQAADRRPAKPRTKTRQKQLKRPADDGTFRATVPGSRRSQG